MTKYYKIAIVGSFFSLWITSFLGKQHQLLLGFFLILTFGILHGANDIVLIKSLNKTEKTLSFFKIIGYYVVIVGVGLIAFFQIPIYSLLFFIIVSGYHFGEQQWQELQGFVSAPFRILFQTTYGVFILLLLFIFNKIEVQNVILQITQYSMQVDYIVLTLKTVSLLLVLLCTYLLIKTKYNKEQLLLEFFYILVFAIIFSVTNLIWGFAIYFIIWHSIPSILDQMKFIYNDNSVRSVKLYVKSALIYWIFALIGIASFYYVMKDEKIFIALFFSFLAAITFPHAFVILKMFGKNKD